MLEFLGIVAPLIIQVCWGAKGAVLAPALGCDLAKGATEISGIGQALQLLGFASSELSSEELCRDLLATHL